jgi:hypothetical protein
MLNPPLASMAWPVHASFESRRVSVGDKRSDARLYLSQASLRMAPQSARVSSVSSIVGGRLPGLPLEPLEMRGDEAIRKARPVELLDESAMAAVTRAYDGQMRGRRQSR